MTRIPARTTGTGILLVHVLVVCTSTTCSKSLCELVQLYVQAYVCVRTVRVLYELYDRTYISLKLRHPHLRGARNHYLLPERLARTSYLARHLVQLRS